MKKILLPLALILGFVLSIQAQDEHIHTERCGHNLLMNGMEAQFPGYKDIVDWTFNEAKRRGAQSVGYREVYEIPVVVHVVWKETEENISDDLINDQIAVLNEDFRAMNADKVNLRAEFGEAVDTEIQFVLAGIERVQTTNEFGLNTSTGLFDDELLKNSANGGSDAWNTEQYLNIWVCNIQPLTLYGIPLGQILGLAYPPASIGDYPDLDNWSDSGILDLLTEPQYDGVIIHYPTFGGRERIINEPSLGGSVPMEGRTCVHEVGHYLGLRHIWGDGGGFSGVDGCSVDDGIDDTPNAASSNQGNCSASLDSCTDPGSDMWENYMDYSEEPCQVAFTAGQKEILRGVLEGPRAGLLASVSVNEAEVLANQVDVLPNPTTGLFNVSTSFVNDDSYTISVVDMLGRQLGIEMDGQGNDTFQIDLTGQPEGMYFIQMTKEGQTFSKKVMLAK